MGPVAAVRPQGKPGAARVDGEKGRQNLRHRAGRVQGERPDLVGGRQRQLQFQLDRQRPEGCERVVQLAVTAAISVLLHRTESSQGTAAEDEVQGHLRRGGQWQRFFILARP